MIELNHEKIRVEPYIKELTEYDNQSALSVIGLLNSQDNRRHFANPYTTYDEIIKVIESKDTHILILREMQDIVGTLTITDAAYPQNSHFISLLAIDEEKQGCGYGRKLLTQAVDWAFTTPNFERRERKSIHLATVMMIPGWERMYNLARSCKFEPKVIWPDQFENGDGTSNDFIRLTLQRNIWK